MQKIKVIHFHNGSGGGVLSVIKNIFKYSTSTSIEHHIIFTINTDKEKEYQIEKIDGAATCKLFYYSASWNFYYTCKKLATLIPNQQAVLVAHDWLELGMVSQLGLQNPVVSILHGDFDYYYQLATMHQKSVDAFICISQVIQTKLHSTLPNKRNAIFFKNFPVPEINCISKKNQLLHAIYYVRDLTEERKQFKLIPKINQLLLQNGIIIQWTIAGSGMTDKEFKEIWGNNDFNNVAFVGVIPNDKILQLLQFQDFFLLPSLQEGLPVALVEAMKAGVVPIITNWNGATATLVIEGETGFYCPIKNAEAYAKIISTFDANRIILQTIAKQASYKANTLFNPYKNTFEIEEVILQLGLSNPIIKYPSKVYGSRLDHSWIPNWVTSTIRKKLI